mgnify:CR=1 FL=1
MGSVLDGCPSRSRNRKHDCLSYLQHDAVALGLCQCCCDTPSSLPASYTIMVLVWPGSGHQSHESHTHTQRQGQRESPMPTLQPTPVSLRPALLSVRYMKIGCCTFTCSTMLLYFACASAAVTPNKPKRSSRRRSRGLNCSSLSGYTTCQLGRGMSRYTCKMCAGGRRQHVCCRIRQPYRPSVSIQPNTSVC